MIQLIKTKLIPTHKSKNEYFPSNEQLKTVVKVMGLFTVSLFATFTVYSYRQYNAIKDILPLAHLPIMSMPGFIYKNLSEEGIAFLHPSNIGKRIAWCGFHGCFIQTTMPPWREFLVKNIYSSIESLKKLIECSLR